jgi:ribosomal protein S18 acetylase RimI-like enzyme
VAALLRSGDLRARLARAARVRAMERFDERRVFDTLLSCYRRLDAVAIPDRQPPGEVRVRTATLSDVGAMARIHRDALPGAFLPELGQGFMERLYRALVDDPGAVALVVQNGAGVVGMATGVASVRGFYRRFCLRHGLMAGLSAVPYLIRPGVLRRVRETASYPRTNRSVDAEVLSIAVASDWRARGAGGALLGGILRGLERRGVPEVKVVVGGDNDPANRLYARAGFQRVGTVVVHTGRLSNMWVKACRS